MDKILASHFNSWMIGWISCLRQICWVRRLIMCIKNLKSTGFFSSGKPSAADLSLGLATAPVLFASEQFPELNKLILRRFSEKGDVETAFRLVMDSEGLQQTRMLANKYKEAAMESIRSMGESGDKEKLAYIAEKVICRMN